MLEIRSTLLTLTSAKSFHDFELPCLDPLHPKQLRPAGDVGQHDGGEVREVVTERLRSCSVSSV